jgi:hypothetical protein
MLNLYVKDTLRELVGLPTSADVLRRNKKRIITQGDILDKRIQMEEYKLKKEQDKLDELRDRKARHGKPITYHQVEAIMRSIALKNRQLKNLYNMKQINDKASDDIIDYETNKDLVEVKKITTELGMVDFGDKSKLPNIMDKQDEISINKQIFQEAMGITDDTKDIDEEVADAAMDFFATHMLDGDIQLQGLPRYDVVKKSRNDGEGGLPMIDTTGVSGLKGT